MVARKKVGINFFFNNYSNSGIVNYIYNIIAALKTLPDNQKPKLFIFYGVASPIDYLKSLGYPYAIFLPFNDQPGSKYLRFLNKAFLKFLNWNPYIYFKYTSRVEYLYPYFAFLDKNFEAIPHKIHWLVDFNNLAFPDHYPDKGIEINNFQQLLTNSKDRVVLSSYSLFEELKKYYPNYKCDIRVLRFASFIPELNKDKAQLIFDRKNIQKPYFISPNQFWEHKNQIVLLNAIKFIKVKHPNLDFEVFFTGSMEVNRGKGAFAQKLVQYIETEKLQNYVRFLGVLEREEQLILMKNALCIIQPSFYEGWSTLVEEAKALNKFVILSDLPVHREQNPLNAIFFNPISDEELAEIMVSALQKPPIEQKYDYSENVRIFGEDFMKMLE